jgi:dTDP-4-amino-4,6-dideoxygalactose transaminase
VAAADSPARSIGGVFGLPEAFLFSTVRRETGSLPWQQSARGAGGVEWLANGRCALWRLLEARRPGRLWLPSYLCDTLLESARVCPTEVRFYPMNANLAPETERWLSEVKSTDAVLVIDYFGFPAPAALWKAIGSTGCITIEDASQALLTNGVGRDSDYVLYSPRKFVGVPDGGILRWRRPAAALGAKSLEPAPFDGWLNSFEATWLRREQDRGGIQGPWFDRFRAAEAAQPCGAYAMSALSRRILAGGWDLRAVAAARRRNYRRLRDALRPWALFPDLPPGVAPLGFPVRLPNRDDVRAALIRERIFPPIHWPIRGAVPESFAASHRLADALMTLPCDQRYGAADMDRIISVFRSAGPGKWVAKPAVAGEA